MAEPTPPSAQIHEPKPFASLQKTLPKRAELPKYRVLLHNDDVNDETFVVNTLMELAAVSEQAAALIMIDAHTQGLALVLVTHKERAELYTEQFTSKGLIATMEPEV